MNFAYLDAREVIETLLGPPQEPVEPIPCELDDKWKNFEKELSKFKLEFSSARRELATAMADLNIKREDLTKLRFSIENVSDPELKASLENLIDNYTVDSGLGALTAQCGELRGKVDAMERVLKDTNAERYAKFTCFVCMDALVDTFLDPCGHVICSRCWALTPVRDVVGPPCPGCRSGVSRARKIFTLS